MNSLNDHYIDSLLPENFYFALRDGKFRKDFYPPFSDETAWKKAAESPYAEILVAKAEKALSEPVPSLTYVDYSRIVRDGNREIYEKPYFRRRKVLAYFALALCLTRDREKYILSLLNYVIAILEEWTWCIPAHTLWNGRTLRNIRPTDLFASETGCVMACLLQILGDELEKEQEGIVDWIRERTLERTVYNVIFRKEEDTVTGSWVITRNPQNWSIWCAVNNLYTAIICEKDLVKLELFTREFIRIASRFLSFYDEDGYCPEGPSYYTKAGMMLFRMLDLLNKIQPGSMEKAFADEKIRNIFEFISKIKIGKNDLAAFADGWPMMISNLTSLMPAAVAINSKRLLKMGAGRISDLGAKVNGDYLIASLALLFDYPEDLPEEFPEDDTFTLFPDRLAIFRSGGFSAVMKAGHNLEAHNHLDLGHFSLYSDGEPLIVDAGTGAYTKKHFSSERYTIWHVGAQGHNAPIFGEIRQEVGSNFTAKLDLLQEGRLQCDLSSAYPEKLGVKHFFRTLDFSPEKVILEDDFALQEPRAFTITLLSLKKPEVLSGGLIRIGDILLKLEGIAFERVEEMPELFIRFGQSLWGCPLTAIHLSGNVSKSRMTFEKEKQES